MRIINFITNILAGIWGCIIILGAAIGAAIWLMCALLVIAWEDKEGEWK